MNRVSADLVLVGNDWVVVILENGEETSFSFALKENAENWLLAQGTRLGFVAPPNAALGDFVAFCPTALYEGHSEK